MNNIITIEKIEKYFAVTQKALEMAKDAFNPKEQKRAEDFFDMSQRYFDDARYFYTEKKDCVLAFAALNYAHGWLDAGARARFFLVNDSTLFTVDGKDE
jgi:uncharacterized protein